jgi:hypothetical protein
MVKNYHMKIIFETPRIKFEGELNDSAAAGKIAAKLPVEAKVNTWGDEIYFKVPVSCPPENATLDVQVGDIAYWPEGGCLCVFFGRTPVSADNNPKPASEVNIVGRVAGDVAPLKRIKSGEKIMVRTAG